ncbi:ABC transporter ATP-binding protein/permease [Oceanotoga sp. DSM 15011]|uniref:ATP-binding cassette subfamily B protein n=1 Tax=Oceanotoga teriensis TaxID=515440 RepID=A0AA45C8Y9_9BACT|nr:MULTISPECIES: ABC transporter ATP-binding protein [Oceanotoga]MDN5342721.1 ATP-binding cassette, subfamily bacterial [Oceanotoga sp.]MDO7977606.1 ABC transporter ATP-binding protein/permease [Oceanotoga teriensis]PWJ96455.1 ATP-binding cassette subfamily B protein [Oceanotoga teriensis]UYP00371.1 ABC transporter ATP-binding protein/permease [Oceanotoga sp. DSM 15011]
MLKRFAEYYKPHKFLFIIDMTAAFLISVSDLVYPLISRYILNDLIPNKNLNKIIFFGIFLTVLYLVRMFLEYVVGYWGHVLGVKIQYDMRKDLYQHLQKLSFKFYDNNKTGHIMSRIVNDLFEISEVAHHGPENLFISSIKVIGSFIILLFINVKLTLITFAIIPFMFWFMIYYNNKLEKAFRDLKRRTSNINAKISESISGIRVVQTYTNEDYENKKFDENNKSLRDARRQAVKHIGIFDSVVNFFSNMAIVINLVIGGIFVYKNIINIGDFFAYSILIGQFLTPLNVLLRFIEQYQQGAAGFRRFLEIMDTEPDIKDSSNALRLKNVEGNVQFKNVTFKYDEGKNILKSINLFVKKGENIAIVGPSGSGKTTLCSLIPRFYEISDGEILIDQINIKNVTLRSLRENVGVVQQDVVLFSGSILENIRYGKLDASEDEIIEASKAANAHDFILNLENGYDTYIGERGVKLSGGQKQRLSIARMFLKNPSILILDEATSALDNKSEKIIQKSIENLSKNRTTFIIAHRLSTVKNADRIIVLTEDGIIEDGNHNELIENKGLYYSLYNSQNNDFIKS